MIIKIFISIGILFLALTGAVAVDRYVAQGGQTPAGGYTTWDTASTNIQDAVSVASVDETVWISNGVYTVGLSNMIVYINKGIRLRGFSGNRGDVILEGPALTEPSRVTRGIYIASTNYDYVLVDSITISNCTINGYGAGVYISGNATYPGTTVLQNCSIVHGTNVNGSVGGGSIYSAQTAGSAYHTILTNCTIANNWSSNRNFAGGYFNYGKGTVNNCLISGNGISPNTDRGYGFNMNATGTVRNCRIEKHIYGGSWAMALSVGKNVLVENCAIVSNWGPSASGVFVSSVSNVIFRNCIVSHNNTTANGGGFYIWNAGVNFENCTIVSNNAAMIIRQTGAITGTVILANNVISSNTANFQGIAGHFSATNNCCSTDLAAYGPNNITDSPQFVSYLDGDFRLSSNSPCINTGTNTSWMTNSLDQDTLPRIIQSIVDMGAYEAAYLLSVSPPLMFTNTVMRGSETNMTVFLTNSSPNAQVCWQAIITSAWVRSATTGITVTTSSTNTLTVTNTSLGVSPGTYISRTAFISSAMLHYYQTGVVDMVMHVAEFARNPTQLTATVHQFGTTNTSVSIWNAGDGDIPYTVQTNVSWLAVEPSSGTLTGSTQVLNINFTNTPLPLGVYYGTVTLVPGIIGDSLQLNVELTVTTGPQMSVAPLILSGSVMMGQDLANQMI
ncbi:choice-of-anchor Q domain-containing protein, partial [Verrucomicrobiota bacterium]